MIRVGVNSVGVYAPGMEGWAMAREALLSAGTYDPGQAMQAPKPEVLPANERRRTTALIKLALQAAQEASETYQNDPSTLATVFASSGGDLEIVDRILTSLDLEGSPVSPTHFHNSVHNAPAGYWSIASGSHAPSTSLSAFDASFSVALLESAMQVLSNEQPVMMVAYDLPPPQPIYPFRPLVAPFAVALVLVPETQASLARLSIESVPAGIETTMPDPGLEQLRLGCPAARSLPLLVALASSDSVPLHLPELPGRGLDIEAALC
jgi:hypothetical protein